MTTGQNTLTFDQILTDAKEWGEDAGRGADTQVKLYQRMAEGGYHGTLSLEPNKHGTGVSDAAKIAEAYFKARSGATIFDAKAGNQRKLISCVRKMIEIGCWPKGGQGEPLATINQLLTIRQGLRKDPVQSKKLTDAGDTLLRYARVQLKRDVLITDPDELKGFCFKSVGPTQSVEDIIEASRKQLMNLRDGKAAHGTALDNSKEVVAAIQSLTDRLKAIAAKRGQNNATAPAGQAIPTP